VPSPGFGWNLFSRCCANVFAFSLLRAHLPSVSLMGGTWATGHFRYFVAFQREYSLLLSWVSSEKNLLNDDCLTILISLDNCWLMLFRRFLLSGFLDWRHFLQSLHFSAMRFIIYFGKLRPFVLITVIGC
jgi:hypothetical protein